MPLAARWGKDTAYAALLIPVGYAFFGWVYFGFIGWIASAK
jgi:hypothetical protein